MTFAAKLKSERKRLGLTQPEAAAFLDIPARTYWEWEHDKTQPPAIAQEGALVRLAAGKINARPKRGKPVA